MAGHSKWANIQHRKKAQDNKRGKVFTKVIREITVATKLAGPDINSNSRLRLALSKANSANVPKDTIERAIKKASGQSDENYEEITYEGYGPKGVAIIIECLTDNKNRTVSKIRTLFEKNGGALGTQGSASHNFKQLGVIKIEKKEASEEKIFELAIDSGAKECISDNEYHEIHTNINEIYEVKKKLENEIPNFVSTELEWLPLNLVSLNGDNKDNMIKFLEALDDEDDVQNIYTNAKFEN